MKKYWTSLDDLVENNLVTCNEDLRQVTQEFQIKINPTMQNALKNRVDDPIFQQFVPTDREALILERELADPIGDKRFSAIEGVVHRYRDRALLKVTQLCEVYCRFCFRKEMIGQKGERLTEKDLENAYHYFRNHPEIWEVILTGGDPLILSNRRLKEIINKLTDIPHIKIIRIHTRIPVINPNRIEKELLTIFEEIMAKGVMIYIVIHANHANEFTQEAVTALYNLRKNGVVLLSQSVLLKGVNDSVEALSALMRTFVANGIKPYYLHQMDWARGTSHFNVDEESAISLVRELRRLNSGICIPNLIQEIPEGEGKKILV